MMKCVPLLHKNLRQYNPAADDRCKRSPDNYSMLNTEPRLPGFSGSAERIRWCAVLQSSYLFKRCRAKTRPVGGYLYAPHGYAHCLHGFPGVIGRIRWCAAPDTRGEDAAGTHIQSLFILSCFTSCHFDRSGEISLFMLIHFYKRRKGKQKKIRSEFVEAKITITMQIGLCISGILSCRTRVLRSVHRTVPSSVYNFRPVFPAGI